MLIVNAQQALLFRLYTSTTICSLAPLARTRRCALRSTKETDHRDGTIQVQSFKRRGEAHGELPLRKRMPECPVVIVGDADTKLKMEGLETV